MSPPYTSKITRFKTSLTINKESRVRPALFFYTDFKLERLNKYTMAIFKSNSQEDEQEVSSPVVKEKAPKQEAAKKAVKKEEPKKEVKKEADEAAAKKERIRKRNLGYI